jgi:hypothetical protein
MNAQQIADIARQQDRVPESLEELAQQWDQEALRRVTLEGRHSAQLQAQRCRDAASIMRVDQ